MVNISGGLQSADIGVSKVPRMIGCVCVCAVESNFCASCGECEILAETTEQVDANVSTTTEQRNACLLVSSNYFWSTLWGRGVCVWRGGGRDEWTKT